MTTASSDGLLRSGVGEVVRQIGVEGHAVAGGERCRRRRSAARRCRARRSRSRGCPARASAGRRGRRSPRRARACGADLGALAGQRRREDLVPVAAVAPPWRRSAARTMVTAPSSSRRSSCEAQLEAGGDPRGDARVGLVSPRSTCESIGAQTPERSARSRSERPFASRSAFTRGPMWICDSISSTTRHYGAYVITYSAVTRVQPCAAHRPAPDVLVLAGRRHSIGEAWMHGVLAGLEDADRRGFTRGPRPSSGPARARSWRRAWQSGGGHRDRVAARGARRASGFAEVRRRRRRARKRSRSALQRGQGRRARRRAGRLGQLSAPLAWRRGGRGERPSRRARSRGPRCSSSGSVPGGAAAQHQLPRARGAMGRSASTGACGSSQLTERGRAGGSCSGRRARRRVRSVADAV